MRPTEGRNEIVERLFVRQIHDRQPGAPPVLVAVKYIVKSYGKVEEIACCNAGWVVVVVLRASRRYFYQSGTIQRCRAQSSRTDRHGRSGKHQPAMKSRLELLIRRYPRHVHDGVGPIRPIIAIAS